MCIEQGGHGAVRQFLVTIEIAGKRDYRLISARSYSQIATMFPLARLLAVQAMG